MLAAREPLYHAFSSTLNPSATILRIESVPAFRISRTFMASRSTGVLSRADATTADTGHTPGKAVSDTEMSNMASNGWCVVGTNVVRQIKHRAVSCWFGSKVQLDLDSGACPPEFFISTNYAAPCKIENAGGPLHSLM